MKTKIFLTPIFVCLLVLNIQAQDKRDNNTLVYSGKVVDAETKKPVVFANVYLNGSGIGTVTNSEGEFIIRVPENYVASQLVITYLGYKNAIVSLKEFTNKEKTIFLEPSPIPIEEIIVRNKDPYELVKAALKNIKQNYLDKPERQIGFYREYIKQNRHYVEIAEAVLDIYKSSYTNELDYDRIKIFKGRKSYDVKKMDTVIFKFQGGPKTCFLLDVVKNPANLLSQDMINYYEYKLNGLTRINDRDVYIISFNQKERLPFALYQGNLYLDVKTLAIIGIDFKISEKALDLAVDDLVRKKPVGMKINLVSANYLVNYLQSHNKWYLNHVKSELVFNCKWDKKLFKSNYVISFEMVVTDRDTMNVEKFKQRETVSISDVLADKVDYFADDNFWGDYNIIKPDENIETAIKKLSRKLKFK